MGTGALIGWGVSRRDFDNDGDEDLIIANGNYYTERVSAGFFGAHLPNPGRQLLRYYQNDGTDDFRDSSLSAGAPFQQPGSRYSLAVADFDLDGCYDLVVTPKDLSNGVGEGIDDEYDLGVRVLRNQCEYPNARVGYVAPDDAIRVELQSDAGDVLVREFKASPGVASSSDTHRIIIGLPAGFLTASGVLSRRIDGEVVSQEIPAPQLEAGQYHSLVD